MAQPFEVKVTINNHVPPKFSFVPPHLDVKGKGKVIWKKGEGSENFTFAAVAFYRPNPFSGVVVSNDDITADDDNPKKEEHIYSVLISVQTSGKTVYYSSLGHLLSGDGPTIRNK